MAEFVGTYKFDKDDGKFDDFLKAMSEYSTAAAINDLHDSSSKCRKMKTNHFNIHSILPLQQTSAL